MFFNATSVRHSAPKGRLAVLQEELHRSDVLMFSHEMDWQKFTSAFGESCNRGLRVLVSNILHSKFDYLSPT